jgi:ketosteroid isomerase-like protein
MKTPTTLIVLSVSAPLALAGGVPTQSDIRVQQVLNINMASSTENELRAVHSVRARADAKSDHAFLTELVDENFRYTSEHGDWLDKNAFVALDAPAGVSVTHDDVRVRIFGDVGLVHGLMTKHAAGGVQLQRYTDVYRKDGKTWRLISTQISEVADPTASTLDRAAPPAHKAWSGSDPTGDDEQVLQALNAGYVQAFLDSDVAWYDQHLDADYLVVFSDGSFHDKGSLLAAAAHPVTNMKSFPTVNVTIRRFDDVALIHAENPYERTDGLKGVNRYTDIWHKRNGRWLCIAAHVTRHKLPS